MKLCRRKISEYSCVTIAIILPRCQLKTPAGRVIQFTHTIVSKSYCNTVIGGIIRNDYCGLCSMDYDNVATDLAKGLKENGGVIKPGLCKKNICTYVRMYVYTYIYSFVCAHTYVCMYMILYLYLYLYTCIYYIYIII